MSHAGMEGLTERIGEGSGKQEGSWKVLAPFQQWELIKLRTWLRNHSATHRSPCQRGSEYQRLANSQHDELLRF